MGVLVNGVWQEREDARTDARGRWHRTSSAVRNWITPDGRPGPTGEGGFKAEPGRYHLYIARACPWAHRTTIFREIKGLSGLIGLSVTHWLMAGNGWTFEPGPGVVSDRVDRVGALPGDYYPEDLRPEIDALNARIYDTLNNGVYRAGFASRQEAYEEAV